ncbi:hypothetical protein ACLQ2R_17385 [Streptosporangium sp. DT93]|uniref:hypothetical protein n=1 Tax=Streptosporangium sp. DT93 TaxID=3393428 RepID=UPI003CF494C4
MNPPLPLDVVPCPNGDAILNLHGLLTARLTPEQQHQLANLLPALNAAREPELIAD